MLNIQNLKVSNQNKPIIHNLSMIIPRGECHLLLGKNGSGKSTLAHAIIGSTQLNCQATQLDLDNDSLHQLAPNERALKGIFLAYQNPIELPGVKMLSYLHSICHAKQEHDGQPLVNISEFIQKAKQACEELHIPADMLDRFMNVGASGGEKKKNELLQMLLLQPKFIILDEIDSGLDMHAIQWFVSFLNKFRSPERTFLIITHRFELIDSLNPDKIWILDKGQIVQEGKESLVEQLKQQGLNLNGK